jgi:hypothetical protein
MLLIIKDIFGCGTLKLYLLGVGRERTPYPLSSVNQ